MPFPAEEFVRLKSQKGLLITSEVLGERELLGSFGDIASLGLLETRLLPA